MMHPNANCPQCSALLPPGAQRCNYCGFVTPWGANLAAVEQRAASIQQDQAKRQRVEKARSTARTGMILAIVGLPICCAPLALVGGAMGWKGARMARAEGEPRPVTSVVAMVIAGLSVIAFATLSIMYYRDVRANEDRQADVKGRLEGRREGELDQKLACELIEEHLAKRGFAGSTSGLGLGEVHCDGALAVTDRRASLPDVRFAFSNSHHTAIACLERRQRWFVLKMLESGSCEALPPAAEWNEPPRKLSEAELEADEAKARTFADKAVSDAAVKVFTDKMAKIFDHATKTEAAERKCTEADLKAYGVADRKVTILSADLEILQAGGAGHAKAWGMMTSDLLNKALDPKGDAAERADTIQKLQKQFGPLLAVFGSETRRWPVVHGDDSLLGNSKFKYDGGQFEGWLFIYDMETAERKCATTLAFESATELKFRKSRFSSAKKKARQAVLDD
ncbi:MAG: zinc ribbon domain-containing protein, partial [Polyangiaceae bacterium]